MLVRLLSRTESESLRREMGEIEVSPRGIDIMLPKSTHRVLRVYGMKYAAANILKQTLLSQGGDAAVSYHCCVGGKENSDALLFGTTRQLLAACDRLDEQCFGLSGLAKQIREILQRCDTLPAPIRSNYKEFVWGTCTFVMGIVNVTPDSFSGDGLVQAADPVEAAVNQARRFVEDGADIIDVGGESTRPNHEPVDAAEEIRRIVPVIRAIRQAVPVTISADTSKAAVAEEALNAGADWINDVWGLQGDPDMPAVVARHGCPVVLMHNRIGTDYRSLMGEVLSFLADGIRLAVAAGLPEERIMVDPGIGFGKTYSHNLDVLRHLADLKALGRPILVGTSRKSFIGRTLNLPEQERLEGTAATVALAIASGSDIVRVHDVREMVRVSRMADALIGRPSGEPL